MSAKQFGEPVVDWSIPATPSDDVLIGRYTRLEPLDTRRHSAKLFEVNRADAQIWDYLPYGPFDTVEDYSAWTRSMQDKPDPFFYAICERSSDAVLGVASYLRVAPEAGSIEIGHINFSSALQRRALGTEAIYLMIRWAFEQGYRRVEWKCNALNMASRRAAQRYGFSYEGVFRQAGISKGYNRDTSWFAMIDKEWPALHEAFETWLDPQNFDQDGVQHHSLSRLTGPIRVAEDPSLADVTPTPESSSVV